MVRGIKSTSYLTYLRLMKIVNHYLPIPKGFESRDEKWYNDCFEEKGQRNSKEKKSTVTEEFLANVEK